MANTSPLWYTPSYGLPWHCSTLRKRSGDHGNIPLRWCQDTIRRWIVFCTKTGYRLNGFFWGKSNSASLYRTELFGLCLMHFLVRAVAEYQNLDKLSATLCCDNKCALKMSSHHRSCIHYVPVPNAPIYVVVFGQPSSFSMALFDMFMYMVTWTDSWSGNSLPWRSSLNCVCDTLAKKSITTAKARWLHSSLRKM